MHSLACCNGSDLPPCVVIVFLLLRLPRAAQKVGMYITSFNSPQHLSACRVVLEPVAKQQGTNQCAEDAGREINRMPPPLMAQSVTSWKLFSARPKSNPRALPRKPQFATVLLDIPNWKSACRKGGHTYLCIGCPAPLPFPLLLNQDRPACANSIMAANPPVFKLPLPAS
ncbi:hypothetical protein LX32DRAFT_288276 [Colletotrichum zoysiae]|uniref:Uncharacterized protein n=1 Tax=Colletotrichum zoysiae TaxID=1216348 RepID=A0AAD9HN53_9PEZI|nr:hypothetical protein LX32DRAFT_288276 [Colletotrichum zoysiae]